MSNKAISLLTFLSVLHGTLSQAVSIQHKPEVHAAVGQNVSLPCVMLKRNSKVIQVQWHKEDERGKRRLVMFNPLYPLLYYVNVTLEPVRGTNPAELLGSILHLQEVTETDSGVYVCEIHSFPHGSVKYASKLQVTVPKVSVEATPTDGTVNEGDTVNVTCVSDPPPDKYILSFVQVSEKCKAVEGWKLCCQSPATNLLHGVTLCNSVQSRSLMESQDGEFQIRNVTRHMSDLICRPLWNSSSQLLQSLNATVHLTIDFFDNIECNSESHVQVEPKTNLTISCTAESSRSLHFSWMKGDVTVSSGSSLNLRSVRPDQSGIYTLMVRTRNYPLHRQKEFTVTVMNGTRPEPPSTTMETTPRVTTTHQPSVRTPTSQPQHTSSISDATATEVAYISASASSTGNVTVVKYTTPHAGVKSPDFTSAHTPAEDRTLCCTSSQGSTSREIHYVPSDTSTFVFASASISSATVRIGNDLTTKMTKQDDGASESHVVFVAVPFLLLLLLIVFLYRKYLVQKRLDMPPPFKPPPPPVKYTSARNHDMPVTDILV